MANTSTRKQIVKNYWSANENLFHTYLERENHLNIHYGFNTEDDFDNTKKSTNRLNEVLADAANIHTGDHVLFCGCGVGGPAIWAVKNYNINAIGLNIVGAQIDKARKNAENAQVAQQTDFRYDDFTKMQTLNYGDVDVIWAIEAVVAAENKSKFLEAAKHALGDNGRFAIAEGFRAVRYPSRKDEKRLEKLEEGWGLPEIVHIDDFIGDMKSYGYKNIEVRDITKNILPFARWQYLGRHYPYLIKIQHYLGSLSDYETKQLLNQNNQYHLFNNGTMSYNIITAEVTNSV